MWLVRWLAIPCAALLDVCRAIAPERRTMTDPSCASCRDGQVIVAAAWDDGVLVELELTEDPRGAWSCRNCERSYRVWIVAA